MGYTFRIGNAMPYFDKDDFPHLRADWCVEGKVLEIAPSFPNNDSDARANRMSSSYSSWHEFCRETGIYTIFFDERRQLHAKHPGCIGITKGDADVVTACLARYKATATLPPGFHPWTHGNDEPPIYDGYLAMLIWLEFWMQWAVANCETPAIENR